MNAYIINSVFFCLSLCFNRIYTSLEFLSFSRTFTAKLYHVSHTGFHISSFLHGIWLPISFFIIFQTFSMGFMSRQFSGHSRTGIPLHSLNVLVLLEVWHGVRSCIKTYPFFGNTTNSHTISTAWIISLLYFALSMLPFNFLVRDRHLLLMAPQTCTLTGDFTVA